MNGIKKFIKIILKVISTLFYLIIFLLLLPVLFFAGAFKKKNKNGIPYIKGMNTEYEISCPECGHSDRFMIGCAHTFDEPIVGYSSELGYCPKCKEPIYRSSHPSKRKGYICPNCGSETKEYKIGSNVKLRCPKCLSNKLKVTDLERLWMT